MLAEAVGVVLLLTTGACPASHVNLIPAQVTCWTISKLLPVCFETLVEWRTLIRPPSTVVWIKLMHFGLNVGTHISNQQPNKLVQSWMEDVMKSLVLQVAPKGFDSHCCAKPEKTTTRETCSEYPFLRRIPRSPHIAPYFAQTALVAEGVHLVNGIRTNLLCTTVVPETIWKQGMFTEVLGEEMKEPFAMGSGAKDVRLVVFKDRF